MAGCIKQIFKRNRILEEIMPSDNNIIKKYSELRIIKHSVAIHKHIILQYVLDSYKSKKHTQR